MSCDPPPHCVPAWSHVGTLEVNQHPMGAAMFVPPACGNVIKEPISSLPPVLKQMGQAVLRIVGFEMVVKWLALEKWPGVALIAP